MTDARRAAAAYNIRLSILFICSSPTSPSLSLLPKPTPLRFIKTTTTMSHHVLLLGGHGAIALHLTPLLLKRSWAVTSVIRNPDQIPAIKKTAEGLRGSLNVLVRSLDDIKVESQAKSIIDEVKPDYVVWSAGAGGKGGPERTFAVDRDAAIYFINAAAATPTVTKFLLVSYLYSRREKPSWWSDESWAIGQHVNSNVLTSYYQAKIVADEELYKASKKRSDFIGIDLRPGTLSAEPAGKVELGKTKLGKGTISREAVAQVAALLLDREDIGNTWLDLLDGTEDPAAAVERVAREGVNAAEGESIF